MAGLIAALFGGHRSPVTNPEPGIGGYDMPRGPYGEGGFPGSTPAAVPTHPQSDEGTRQRELTATQAQDEWKHLPSRRLNGTPRQPYARNKAQADDTERRSSPVIGIDVPGNENQRNTVYYGGRKAAPDGQNRYVYGGENGGFESYAVDRRIPYKIHERPGGYRGNDSVRGADLSGQRYVMAGKEQTAGLPDGQYGIARKRGPLHRPVRFERPGPWSAHYYDVAPSAGTQAPDMSHESPSKHGSAPKVHKPEHRSNGLEKRKSPPRKVRRG